MLFEKKHSGTSAKHTLPAYRQNFRLKLIAFAIGKMCVLWHVVPQNTFCSAKILPIRRWGKNPPKSDFLIEKGGERRHWNLHRPMAIKTR
jgi:hypothetical protein